MPVVATVAEGFSYDELTVPPAFEVELLGATVARRTVRHRRGAKLTFGDSADYREFRDLARRYGGRVEIDLRASYDTIRPAGY